MSWTSKWRWPMRRVDGLADDGEGLRQDVVSGLSCGEALAELRGQGGELVVGHSGRFVGELIDLVDDRPELLQLFFVVFTAEQAVDKAHNGLMIAGERWRSSLSSLVVVAG